MLSVLRDLYVALPVNDYWRVPQNLPAAHAHNFAFLWSQHNEHRIVFPELVFLADSLFFHGLRILPIAIATAGYVLCWLLLSGLVLKETRMSLSARLSAAFLAGGVIGWKGSALVLADPFLLQWVFLIGGVLLSLLLLYYSTNGSSPYVLAGSIAAAILATYSSANGLLLWPLLLAGGWVRRFSRKRMFLLLIAACVATSLYFAGYRFSGQTNLASVALHPVYAARFVGMYFSMPFGGMKSPQFGVYVGWANLTLAAILLLKSVRTGELRRSLDFVCLGWYLFLLVSAVIIAAGRMEPADTTFTNAKATRYLAPVLFNWGVCIVLAVRAAALSRRRALLVPLVSASIAALLLISTLKLKWWFQMGMREFVNAQVAELSVENQLDDPRLLRFLFPDASFVEHYLPILKADRAAIYFTDRARRLGEPLPRDVSREQVVAGGQITRIFPVISGMEVVGWSDEPGFQLVLLSNSSGDIIGYGRRLPNGLPSELLTPDTPARNAWIAFVPGKLAQGSVQALIQTAHGTLRPLPAATDFPAISSIRKVEAGPPIDSVHWAPAPAPAWTNHGTPPEKLKGDAAADPVYASWSGTDANTGSLSMEFDVPSGGCFVLPALHGRSITGLSIEILDPASETLINEIPMQAEDVQWEFWRVPERRTHRRVKVLARDQSAFGWLATATPLRCRE